MTTMKPLDTEVLYKLTSLLEQDDYSFMDEGSFSRMMVTLSPYYPEKAAFWRNEEKAKPDVTVSWKDGQYVLTQDGNIVGNYPTLDKAITDLGLQKSGLHLLGYGCDDSIILSPEVKSHDGYLVKTLDGGSYLSHSLTSEESHLMSFAFYLRKAKAWIENQDNFLLAYNFLAGHPIMWYRPDAHTSPNHWAYTASDKIFTDVSNEEDGAPVIMMETGPSVGPLYAYHSHDHWLDVYGATFEDAYIQLAKRIHTYYHFNGISTNAPSPFIKD